MSRHQACSKFKYMRILQIIIFIISPFLLFSQTKSLSNKGSYKYKVSYQLNYQPDSTNSENIESEKMLLYIGDNFSRFSSAGQSIGDSLMNSRDKSEKSRSEFARLRSQIPNSRFTYYVYKGIPEGKLSYTRKLLKDNFRYIEDLQGLKWEIIPGTKEVFGYKAQKAEVSFEGRDYIAWFTEKIPISEGPYKFQGLPGLIIKIRDRKNHYNFELLEFKKLKKPIKIKFAESDFITTSKLKVQQVQQEYDRDPISFLERSGMTFSYEQGERERNHKKHLEYLKKRNNPIELK